MSDYVFYLLCDIKCIVIAVCIDLSAIQYKKYNIRNLCTPSLTVKNRHESAMDVP